MRIVDLDGDGLPDLFGAMHTQENAVEIWRNLTPRGKLPLDRWTRHVIDADKGGKGIFIAAHDLDGDGRKDIVTGPAWYRNPGDAAGNWAKKLVGAPMNNLALAGTARASRGSQPSGGR